MAARTVGRSQAERMWMIGGALLALLTVVIGYFFFIGPQRDETANLQSQAADAATQNSLLQAKVNSLRTQNLDLAKYQSQLARAREALPPTSGLPDFLRTLQSLSSSTLTSVDQLNVDTPKDVTAVAAGNATATASAEPSGGNAAAVAQAPAPAPAATAAVPGGIYALPITAVVKGTPAALNAFLDQLQNVQPRAVLITAITEGTDPGASTDRTGRGAMSLNLTMAAFVATPGGPSAPATIPTPGR